LIFGAFKFSTSFTFLDHHVCYQLNANTIIICVSSQHTDQITWTQLYQQETVS